MGIVYIAVLLSSGIVFTQLHYPAKYQLNRSEGWMTYASIVSYGLLFLMVSLPLMLWVDTQNYGRLITVFFDLKHKQITEWGFQFYQLKLIAWFTGSLILSLLFGCTSYIAYHWLPYVSSRLIGWHTSRLSKQDPLEHLIFENTRQKKLYGGWD